MLRPSTTLGILSALLLASPLALAVEAHHREGTPLSSAGAPPVVVSQAPGADAEPEAGVPDTEPPSAISAAEGGEAPAGDSPATAGMPGSPGGMDMMPRGMMSGLHGGDGGQGAMPMGTGMGMMPKGMMAGGGPGGGMMGRGMGQSMGAMGGMGCPGMMQQKFGKLMGRLDVLEARTAKIEAMLERLLQR
jgi:hypothetical protein